MLQRAEILIRNVNDPAYWGNSRNPYPDPADSSWTVHDIWRWAEANGRRDIQGGIASLVVGWQRGLESALRKRRWHDFDERGELVGKAWTHD